MLAQERVERALETIQLEWTIKWNCNPSLNNWEFRSYLAGRLCALGIAPIKSFDIREALSEVGIDLFVSDANIAMIHQSLERQLVS